MIRFGRLFALSVAIVSSSALLGCSWQLAYDTAQAWQRNSCLKIMNTQERERCLAGAQMPYEDYKRQTQTGNGER